MAAENPKEQHTAYEEYTWEQVGKALYGVAPRWNTGGAHPYQHAFSGQDFLKIYPAGMLKLSNAFGNVHLRLNQAYWQIWLELRGLIGTEEAPGVGGKWTGPAARHFGRISHTLARYADDIAGAMREPSWPNLTVEVYNAYTTAVAEYNDAWNRSWVFKPSTLAKVPINPGGGRGGGGYKTVGEAAHYEWDTNLAATNARPVIIKLADSYKRIMTSFNELPAPPNLGEKPSAIADKEEAEATAKQEKEDLKKEKEDFKKEKEEADAEAKKEKEDLKKEKAEADAEAKKEKEEAKKEAKAAEERAEKRALEAEERANKRADEAAKKAEDAAKEQQDAFDKQIKDQPPPPELSPPELSPPPEPPPLLDQDGLLGDPGADPFAPPPDAIPKFFGGTPVPGGIDLDGDGQPELDEKGQLLPGVDPSTLPPPLRPPLASGDGPPVFPPGTLFLPPTPPGGLKDDLALGPGALAGRGAKPFVRSPNADLDPFKPGVQTSTGRPGAAIEVDSGRLPRTAGGGLGSAPNQAGAAGGRSLVGVPGLPGAGFPGAAAPPMYPPPMGGMGPMGAGGGQPNQERERQTWLLEDDEIWSDGDEPSSVLGRPGDDDDDDEF